MLLYNLIFKLLFTNRRSKSGTVLLITILLFCLIFVIKLALQEESYIRFVEDSNLTIDRRSSNPHNEVTWPWYASDKNNYYVLVPGYYRVMPKENECRGFNRFDEGTWCIESPEDFKCYPYTDLGADDGCGVVLVDQ